MKLKKDQILQVVARGLIFRQGHLLVTQWRDRYAFPIGGRVEHGETLHDAVLREVHEETGAAGRVGKLLYFNEHFWHGKGIDWHELGWFYLFETDDEVCPLDARIPNPDSPDLFIRWMPVADVPTAFFLPRFFNGYLLDDYRSGFRDAPRHVVLDERATPPLLRQVDDGYQRSPGDRNEFGQPDV